MAGWDDFKPSVDFRPAAPSTDEGAGRRREHGTEGFLKRIFENYHFENSLENLYLSPWGSVNVVTSTTPEPACLPACLDSNNNPSSSLLDRVTLDTLCGLPVSASSSVKQRC